jgi:NAD(P)-dependent dehydrogenase (short-subunit alcohol dehydrogenase family)
LSDDPRTGRGGRILAAAALGAAVGATTSAGNALLLYTGQGFLRAAGLLFSSTILAIAAGVWAGAADDNDSPPRSRVRWIGLVLTLLLGGGMTMVWSARAELRELALGGAVAVLFVLAVPAYTAGAVLAALQARLQPSHGGGVAPAALGGAAVGVLITTMLLIQNLDASAIYHGAAVAMLLVGLAESRAHLFASDGATTMDGRVAIITGVGDRGQLGFALAQKFLAAGARVVITGLAPDVEQLAAELTPAAHVAAVRADLTNDEDVARVVAAASDRFGRLDALINAAGGLSVIATVADTTVEQWQREIQRNAETVLRTCRAALPLLRVTRGAIVNFASPAALRAAANLGAYSAAKAAVVALTRALALEEQVNGVRVNAIAPGMIDTAQNRLAAGDEGPFVARDDVAAVAVFLASPAAAAITGETVRVMGATLE